MKKIGIIVVTYNRKNELIKNLDCLSKLDSVEGFSYKVFVIDNNSTDGTENIMVSRQDIEYVRLDNNVGGAGGFYFGIKQCMEDKMDFIWGMDDDAFPERDSLKNLIIEYEKNPNRCYWSNCNADKEFQNNGLKKTDVWMFVGFFLDSEKIQKVGYPRKDFFIYHDDAEYAYRLQKNGYEIIKVANSIINHKDSFESNIRTKFIMGKTVKYFQVPNWKCYYLIRNELLMWRYSELNFWKSLYKYMRYIVIVLIFNPKQVGVAFKAIMHGIFRVSGAKMRP